MVIGSGVIELWIAESHSLKDKRAVLRRILKRAQNEFNVSIAEVGDNDHRRRAKVGFAMVGNDQRFINGKIDHLLSFIEQMQLAEVIHSRIEITGFSGAMDSSEFTTEKYDDF
ncbi:MAG: DUF503 domain-containing protein [Syntrophales bacterium]|nr:DUF503 domain-containing protein [Syntrophales bacterium]PKN60344.1 MAG: DUF503 domain-containing protein [Deltaproteobacteria bacterium HGW-Deltaproteobacteria-11]